MKTLTVRPIAWFVLLVTVVLLAETVAPIHASAAESLKTFTFADMPVVGTTIMGQAIKLGGFSGLIFEGKSADGKLQFIANTDRGPNGAALQIKHIAVRPFALPQFQPQWIRFTLDIASGQLAITERIGLVLPDGKPITGLPNLTGRPGMAYNDEIPVNVKGAELTYDALGEDLEGMTRAPDGSYWMVEEYRPSILHFDSTGKLIERFVPEGSNATVNTGTETLPAVYALRVENHGFEGIAFQDRKVYAFLQTPLDNPDSPDDHIGQGSRNLRILEFDTNLKRTTAEYLYLMEDKADSKIGDAVALGNGEFLIVEHNDKNGRKALKMVYRITLNGATNLMTLDKSVVGVGGTLESLSSKQLKAQNIMPVGKTPFVDLLAAGYSLDKIEGLALIDPHTIAVVNDNDFGVGAANLNFVTGLFDGKLNEASPIILGVFTVDTPQ